MQKYGIKFLHKISHKNPFFLFILKPKVVSQKHIIALFEYVHVVCIALVIKYVNNISNEVNN